MILVEKMKNLKTMQQLYLEYIVKKYEKNLKIKYETFLRRNYFSCYYKKEEGVEYNKC